MPKPSKQSSATKVTPFAVKRKQINFNLLDKPISRNSSQSSVTHLPSECTTTSTTTTASTTNITVNMLKENGELKKQLNQITQELQTARHQYRLMENERQKFESTIIETYSKEKEAVELELRVLKQTHLEKIQSLSTTVNRLSTSVTCLRDQLKKNDIKEEAYQDLDQTLLFESNQYNHDARFIQDAYNKTKNEPHTPNPLWQSVQNTTFCIKNEINNVHAWKSIPVADLAKLLKEDQKQQQQLQQNNNNPVRSLLFGRLKERAK